MNLAIDMLLLHLPLTPSARGQKVEAKLVGLSQQGRSQRWAAMSIDEVASLPGTTGLPLGQSRSHTVRTSPFRVKYGRSATATGRVAADAVSRVPTTLVLHAIMPGTQHVPLTDEVPRRLVRSGRVSQGYKSYTKGRGHASEMGRASPQPHLKGCQQRQSRGLSRRFLPLTCSERQNLRVSRGPLRSMGSVSSATAATTWPGGTSFCQPADLLSNNPPQPEIGHGTVSFTLGEINMGLFPIAKVKAHSLTGRITAPLMLAAYKAVKRNRGAAGIDRVSVKMFEANLAENLTALERDLKNGSFQPLPLRRHFIPKGEGFRPLGIPAVRDRVAQEVIRRLLHPIFERLFHDASFGF